MIVVKEFNALTNEELFKIYKLRVSVFIVEQACPYQEVDDADLLSYHVWLEEDGEIKAYCRVIPKGVTFDEVSLGRVIAAERRKGYGTAILKAGIEVAKEKFDAQKIVIEAQVYAQDLYIKQGFKVTSEPFLEDNIPHVRMEWTRS